MKPRVWMNWLLSDEALAPLSELAEVITDGDPDKFSGSTVVVPTFEPVDGAFMDRVGPQLNLLAKPGIGLDNIDISAASERGILVCHTPDAVTESTAEHTVGLLLAVAKRIVAGDMQLRGADVPRSGLLGTEVRGKTLGVVGYGRIGRRVAEICSLAFQMPVLVYDPYIDPNQSTPDGITMTDDMDTIFAQGDFVTIHTPLTAETHHLVVERHFRLMKRGSYLINASRGPVIDEGALIKVLQERHLAGAGLDVFDPEPPEAENPLLSMPNVVVTPHIAASTETCHSAIFNSLVAQIGQVLRGERPTSLANPEAWPGRVEE